MDIRIIYDKTTPVYKPGEKVVGKAIIECQCEEKIRGKAWIIIYKNRLIICSLHIEKVISFWLNLILKFSYPSSVIVCMIRDNCLHINIFE